MLGVMTFSKSFGYAVRGVLYIAMMQNEKRFVQVEEIAAQLLVPRYFMGKILKKMVKEKIISSSKGPAGGFAVNEDTLDTSLLRLINITEGPDVFRTCVLRLKECNSSNPCPLHNQMETLNARLKTILLTTTIRNLMVEDKTDFIRSLSAGGMENRSTAKKSIKSKTHAGGNRV